MLGLTIIAVALGWTAATVWRWLRWKPPVVEVDLPSDRVRAALIGSVGAMVDDEPSGDDGLTRDPRARAPSRSDAEVDA